MLPTERIVRFGTPSRSIVMPAADDSPWTVMTTAWTFETSFGNGYQMLGTTWALNAGKGCLADRVMGVHRVEFRRDEEGQLIRLAIACE